MYVRNVTLKNQVKTLCKYVCTNKCTEDEKIPCQIIIIQEQDKIYIPSSSSATQTNTEM